LHEVQADFVAHTLRLAGQLLRAGGRLLFRDGVKPEDRHSIVLRPKTDYSRAKLRRFLAEYRNRPIEHSIAGDPSAGAIQVSLYDLHDILCKYWYEGQLWESDLDESFGTMSLGEYVRAIHDAGFTV